MSSQSSYPARPINAASPISYIDGRHSSTRRAPYPDSPWGDCLNLVIIMHYPAYTPQRDTMLKINTSTRYTSSYRFYIIFFFEEPCYCYNKRNVVINHNSFCSIRNNNVLIKEIIAGLFQPEWEQALWWRYQRLPSETPGCLCLVRPHTLQHAPRPGGPQGSKG